MRLSPTHPPRLPAAKNVVDCDGRCVGFGQQGIGKSCCKDDRLCGTGLTCQYPNGCQCDSSEYCCTAERVFSLHPAFAVLWRVTLVSTIIGSALRQQACCRVQRAPLTTLQTRLPTLPCTQLPCSAKHAACCRVQHL